MWNKKSTFNLNFKNRKGQIALFIALIFQILFLFFAMVINVGLLVHHKINLQNSVDLAAYYGAMKQAESMNAIAHVNYQIRQSWKLLAWRYRQLGSAGDFSEHPFNKATGQLQGNDDDGINTSAIDFYDAPSFCITYVPFKPMPPGENTCKDLKSKSGIQLFKVPPVIIDLPNISNSVQQLSRQLLDQARQRGQIAGPFNYLMLGSFVVAFNLDQGNRNLLITALSRAMSPSSPEGDSFDIDGDSVQAGIRKTLKNNLTSANLASIQDGDIKTFNSLGDSDCNASSVGKGEPAKWLKPVKIYPAFIYIDVNSIGNYIISSKMLGAEQTDMPFHTDRDGVFQSEINKLKSWIGMRNPANDPYNYSMGVEKNPWCMAYMGVSVKANPKIPFSPFGAVTLKARAFFKPFGGRIGPWYKNRWPSGSPISIGEKIDENLPPRVEGADVQNIGNPKDQTRAANYSRFIGDKWGLKSRRVLFQFGKAIFQLDPRWRPSLTGEVDPALLDPNGAYVGDEAPSFDDWNHIPFNFIDKSGGSGDILAWNSKTNSPSKMRELEMAGILPDAFDFAYYSIEPDFYHNYYTRIRDGFLKKTADGSNYASQKLLLGDIGMHKGYKQGSLNFDEFSIKDQYSYALKGSYAKTALDLENKLTYISKDWKHALTSWAPKSIWDYSFDESRFGKCTTLPAGAENNDPKPPTPGNCVMGGTTGYAVKMVSSDYLRSGELNLGGSGMNGPLLNPPPSDDDF